MVQRPSKPQTGDLVDTLAVTRRFDLTDVQWAVLEPLLPAPKRPGRPSSWSRRQLIDGIRWRIRVGARGGTCHRSTDPPSCCGRFWSPRSCRRRLSRWTDHEDPSHV
ncbi:MULTISPECIES: transposase [Micromonospora]|uniref:transposase n=1 Tax=Micromonospora TaxID=1873 RepID=UPI0034DE1018